MSSRIQEIDGGFFEKFGALFRENAESTASKPKKEEEEEQQPTKDVADESSIESEETPESTSSDSEIEAEQDTLNYISDVWNVDELYAEILYQILHNVGCDVDYEVGKVSLFSYAQDAFKIDNNKHRALMEEAQSKEAPEILLNVEVIEAKDLRPKDSNGLSDPFVTLYLLSDTAHRYNTSVKTGTLNPTWEEHFALPVNDNSAEDALCLEVWDFDPAETVREKFGKFFEVKGVKGMRKLVKEIAVTAATGQHENELIGIAKIPLKTVPASGMTMWYSLDKKNKVHRQGVVKVRVSFSSEKNSQVAEQEHRHLLRIIMLHELEMSKVAPHWWCGTFTPQAETILTQHIAQSGLTPYEVAICQYSVYAKIHEDHALSFALFVNLLEKLIKPLQNGNVCDVDIRIFWDATKKLLPSCFSVIRKIRKKGSKDKTVLQQVTEVLTILQKLIMLEAPEGIDLFPSNLYTWVTFKEGPNCDIISALKDTVTQGANDWLNHILENNAQSNNEDINRMQHLIQVIQLVRTDLQKAIEIYDKVFQETVRVSYAKTLYIYYQAKISLIAEPEICNFCKTLKRLSFSNVDLAQDEDNQTLKEGMVLFEIYLSLQRFYTLGKGLCPIESDGFHVKNFHKWFHAGVAHWLDIAVFKALLRIEKALVLDELKPVDQTVKYSSSAVDTLTIFYQVKIFWQQLSWPDIEGRYTFIAKIIDDICRCCVFYADKMSTKVDGMGDIHDIYEKKFEVTNEWCMAINNIEYVCQAMAPFADELGMQEVIEKLADAKSPVEAQRCEHTLNTVIANAIDTVQNEIIELLGTVVSKMVPAMKRLLIEGAELFNQDSNSIDRLMMYVDNNLRTLHNELNEENFNRILSIVWTTLSEILNEIIQTNLDKRRPPSFFANLHKTLNLMLGSFKNPEECSNCDTLRTTERILKINGLETADLIHQVYLELYKEYKALKDSPYGVLSVKLKFEGNDLHIEVMNARDLMPMDSNGLCDSFVRIHLLPEDKFTNITKPKTQTHNKTLFPLYDEKFVINLPQGSKRTENALILFSVKDKDLLGYNNQYIGEAFVPFSEIEDSNNNLSDMPQIQLQLGRPSNTNSDSIKALEYRQGDKQAKDFLKKYKQRMGT